MGTPNYRAQASPQEEIALEFVPTDREGLVHEIPWDELEDGVYSTETYTEGSIAEEHLDHFMKELKHAVEQDLPGGVGTFSVQTWQKDLKRADLDLEWEAGGEPQSFIQYTYIHRNVAP
jgi:hypothetical protein